MFRRPKKSLLARKLELGDSGSLSGCLQLAVNRAHPNRGRPRSRPRSQWKDYLFHRGTSQDPLGGAGKLDLGIGMIDSLLSWWCLWSDLGYVEWNGWRDGWIFYSLVVLLLQYTPGWTYSRCTMGFADSGLYYDDPMSWYYKTVDKAHTRGKSCHDLIISWCSLVSLHALGSCLLSWQDAAPWFFFLSLLSTTVIIFFAAFSYISQCNCVCGWWYVKLPCAFCLLLVACLWWQVGKWPRLMTWTFDFLPLSL